MENSVALAILSTKLKSIRLQRVEATFLRDGKFETGMIQVRSESNFGKAKSSTQRYACETTVICEGIPKDGGKPAFRISVCVRGIIESLEPLTDGIIRHPMFRREIDKRIYIFAVVHIHQIARGMNLNGLRLEPELDGPVEDLDHPSAKGIAGVPSLSPKPARKRREASAPDKE